MAFMSMPCRNRRSNVPITGPSPVKVEAVADHHPEDRAERDRGERLRHGGEHVLLAHHAGVEQRQARDRSSSARGRSPRSSRRCRRRRSWRAAPRPARTPASRPAPSASQRHCSAPARASANPDHVIPPELSKFQFFTARRCRSRRCGCARRDRGRRQRFCRRRSGRSWRRCRSRRRPCPRCRRRRRPRSCTLGRKFTAYSAPR